MFNIGGKEREPLKITDASWLSLFSKIFYSLIEKLRNLEYKDYNFIIFEALLLKT